MTTLWSPSYNTSSVAFFYWTASEPYATIKEIIQAYTFVHSPETILMKNIIATSFLAFSTVLD